MAAKKKATKKKVTTKKKVAKKAKKKVAKKVAAPKPEPTPPPVVEAEPPSVAEDDVEVTAPSIPQVVTNIEDLDKKKLQELSLVWPLKEKGANPLPGLSVKLYVLDWEKGTVAIKGSSEEQVKAALFVLHTATNEDS